MMYDSVALLQLKCNGGGEGARKVLERSVQSTQKQLPRLREIARPILSFRKPRKCFQ